ncbi:uncharacterized protein LOC112055085 [Bicyclus anynana]|uniref:Uncharacterized protein LOC112055085 n=1 Tax=Bicyclus anynana TaxID=110368 RepID=A0A6J1P0Z0_BICAN|nr:uncharacterized protein LOC112055085 [Bicyclus anynana]
MCFITHLVILLFCVTKCCAKIEINITVASSRRGIKVAVKGTDDKIIGDKEVNIFNITEFNLKRGVKRDFGIAPTPSDVYIKDPTPYGNLFHKYKWQQVTRKTVIKRIATQDIMYENVLLTVHDHTNNTPRKINIPVKLYENVENSLKSYWSASGYPVDDVYYVANIAFSNTKDKRIKFENKWRNDSLKMATLPVGYETAGHITIGPEKVITMKLSAKKTIILLKITYETKLTGNFVANYPRRLGPYHFWAPSVSSVMRALNFNNNIITSEIMEIKCHTDPVLEVFDKSSGKRIPIVFSSSKPIRKPKFKNKIGP